jgi:hypothetical protein
MSNTEAPQTVDRRVRHEPATEVKRAKLALARSRYLSACGALKASNLAAQLADRHTRTAERLTNVEAAIARIHQAKIAAMQALIEREARVAEREAALIARARADPGILNDPEWQDLLGAMDAIRAQVLANRKKEG